jgi:hypothetical protein
MPGAENVGYIIPASIALNFLDEYRLTSSWQGLPEAGIITRGLKNKALRRFLMPADLAEGSNGVQVRSISPLSPLKEKLAAGDVLLEIDGKDITKDGTVRYNISDSVVVQLPFETLITAKPRGASTSLRVLRRGGTEEPISVAFASLPSLAPRYDGVDSSPSYMIVGGLVFTQFSTPLLSQNDQGGGELARLLGQSHSLDISQSVRNEALYRWRKGQGDDHGLVVLLRALKHTVNTGYHLNSVRVLQRVNGEVVTGLSQLVRRVCTVRRAGERFLYFSFSEADGQLPDETPEDPDIVLEVAAIGPADQEMLAANGIPALVSRDLADIWSAACQGLAIGHPGVGGVDIGATAGGGGRGSNNQQTEEFRGSEL